MAQWVAVPKCPSCGTPMRSDDEVENYWKCPDCWFSASQLDLEFRYSDDEDEDD